MSIHVHAIHNKTMWQIWAVVGTALCFGLLPAGIVSLVLALWNFAISG